MKCLTISRRNIFNLHLLRGCACQLLLNERDDDDSGFNWSSSKTDFSRPFGMADPNDFVMAERCRYVASFVRR